MGTAQLNHQKHTSYDLSFSFSPSHNPLHKQLTHLVTNSSGIPSAPGETNFSSAYLYASRPHLPTQIGDLTVNYDPSGNPSVRNKLGTGAQQNLVWDDDGRLVSVSGSSANQLNRYDAFGKRVLRRSVQSETIFASLYFDLENGTQGVKHVFAGGLRVASALAKFDGEAEPASPTKLPVAYFFHADHMGSTGVLTTGEGAIYQSLEYFADGEIWIDRAPQKPSNGYLFNGKAIDPDTGFYDFEQRFYDPRESLWLGVDCSFLQDTPGVVGNTAAVAPVFFAGGSPLRLHDPDGRDPDDLDYISRSNNPIHAFTRWNQRIGNRWSGRTTQVLSNVTIGFLTSPARTAYRWFESLGHAAKDLIAAGGDASKVDPHVSLTLLTTVAGGVPTGGSTGGVTAGVGTASVVGGGESVIRLFHGTTSNAGSKIATGGFRGSAVFFAEDAETAFGFGMEAASRTGARSWSALEFTIPRDIAGQLGLLERHEIGIANGRWIDVGLPGAQGFERILSGADVARFNQLLEEGIIKLRRLRPQYNSME